MKIILAQPAIQRFQWELEVLLTNMRQFGDFEVVLLFKEQDFTVPGYFRKKYPECSVFVYTDKRDDTSYIPSIRPYLLWQYLKEDQSRENETYFYIDSDIIFREWPDFSQLGKDPQELAGANCNSYIGYDYIVQTEKGPQIAAKMAEICGITVEQMQGVPGIGAQLVLTHPTADFWERAYHDSNAIYGYLKGLNSNIQKWTAEMWAQQWGWVREGKHLIVSPELNFCMPTDDIKRWDEEKIMHNAGVTGSGELFFKGNYIDKKPFGENFDYVRKDKVSSKYVEAIEKVIL